MSAGGKGWGASSSRLPEALGFLLAGCPIYPLAMEGGDCQALPCVGGRRGAGRSCIDETDDERAR